MASHIGSCDFCQYEARDKRHREKAEVDARLRFRHIISQFWKAKKTIEDYKAKIKPLENKKKRGRGKPLIDPEEIKEARALQDEANYVKTAMLKKERIWLHKVLNHEDEYLRKAAEAEYQQNFPKELIKFAEKTLGKPLIFPPEQLSREEWYVDMSYRTSLDGMTEERKIKFDHPLLRYDYWDYNTNTNNTTSLQQQQLQH